MHVIPTQDAIAWDAFLSRQRFRPFLQSWTMGEVYKDVGQEPVRLELRDGDEIVGICFGHIVKAKRGTHLAVPYGPVFNDERQTTNDKLPHLLEALKKVAADHACSFIRLSPFCPLSEVPSPTSDVRSVPSPLHLLAEHIWYLPLTNHDTWSTNDERRTTNGPVTEEALFKNFRSTHRNLIRRAEKEGVTVTTSDNPTSDIEHFIRLHDETRKRHGFTPYTNAFFRAQVERFAPRKECSLYLARYQGQVIASSIHMHAFGETSYHHGASASAFNKIPSSYLLQWTAIKDALKRNDHVYSFWGIAPTQLDAEGTRRVTDPRHPFAGVTLFKTGFGGSVIDLIHCMDVPLKKTYHITRAIEVVRKWKRGF